MSSPAQVATRILTPNRSLGRFFLPQASWVCLLTLAVDSTSGTCTSSLPPAQSAGNGSGRLATSLDTPRHTTPRLPPPFQPRAKGVGAPSRAVGTRVGRTMSSVIAGRSTGKMRAGEDRAVPFSIHKDSNVLFLFFFSFDIS